MSDAAAEPTSPKYYMHLHNMSKNTGQPMAVTCVPDNEAAGTGWVATVTYKGVTAMNDVATGRSITARNEAARKVLAALGEDLTKVPS